MQTYRPTTLQKWFSQPLDRVAISLMLGLSVLIGLLLWSGDRTAPRVRDFSWQDKQIGAQDSAFILTFNRPMNQASVQGNLRIEPPLPGKVSWAGRRMAYTLTEPAPYGRTFQVSLSKARDRFSGQESDSTVIQPFLGRFTTRDRAFICLGVEGADAGRLILYNLTQQQKTVLTPPNLAVAEFEPYPQGDLILFSATERGNQRQGSFDPKLYTVSTGLHFSSHDQQKIDRSPPGNVKLVLDNSDAQILKFDLSPNGETIVVQRADRRNLAQSGLWLLPQDASPQLLNNQPGGNFLIAPDSHSLVIAQGQGLAILPLDSQGASQPLDFLPKFGTVLSFAPDGSAAAMVKFNTDYTRSLFLVSNQGSQKELLRTTGSILSAQFEPLKQTLYCLLTQLLPGSDYRERPYIAAIDLQTSQLKPLVILPIQRDLQISLAPDGTALLFDQAASTSQSASPGQAPEATVVTSQLWLLSIQPSFDESPQTKGAPIPRDRAASPEEKQGASGESPPQPEALPLSGFHPRWLP